MNRQADCGRLREIPWEPAELFKTPVTRPAERISTENIAGDIYRTGNEAVKGLFYEGPAWRGKPTSIFAWYGLPKGASPEIKVPAIVLVHGGGATAYAGWVRMWNERGYAAIAMDTCGCLPVGEYSQWKRNEQGGPAGWGGFEQIDEPQRDQWTYHAVSAVILGHSLLRSIPEVDADRIGITGISWGGYLTCIVTGIDSRLRCAAPVYGCGYIGENSVWVPEFEKMGNEKKERWLRWWDPSVYLKNVHQPMLWVSGTNDFAYSMTNWQKSYRTTKGSRTLALRVRMDHGHGGAGESPQEIKTFIDSQLKGASPLAKVTASQENGDEIFACYSSTIPIVKAELNFTDSNEPVWHERVWSTVNAEIDSARHEVRATLPPGTTMYYLNLIDEKGNIVSSEHVER